MYQLIGLLYFFQHIYLLKSLNHTFITLILKKLSSTSLNNDQPISCVGVPYKILAQILSTCLTSILLDLISANQAGFLKGCRILDNVGLVQEFIYGFNNKSIGRRVCIELDFRMAFLIRCGGMRWMRHWVLICSFGNSYSFASSPPPIWCW